MTSSKAAKATPKTRSPHPLVRRLIKLLIWRTSQELNKIASIFSARKPDKPVFSKTPYKRAVKHESPPLCPNSLSMQNSKLSSRKVILLFTKETSPKRASKLAVYQTLVQRVSAKWHYFHQQKTFLIRSTRTMPKRVKSFKTMFTLKRYKKQWVSSQMERD